MLNRTTVNASISSRRLKEYDIYVDLAAAAGLR